MRWGGKLKQMLLAKEIVKMYCEVSEDEFETWLDNNIQKLLEQAIKKDKELKKYGNEITIEVQERK
jgi:hypothetical protein